MTNRLIHQGFKVIPLFGILDEETDILLPAQGTPVDIVGTVGALSEFEDTFRAETFPKMKEDFAQQEKQRQEGREALEAESKAPVKKLAKKTTARTRKTP